HSGSLCLQGERNRDSARRYRLGSCRLLLCGDNLRCAAYRVLESPPFRKARPPAISYREGSGLLPTPVRSSTGCSHPEQRRPRTKRPTTPEPTSSSSFPGAPLRRRNKNILTPQLTQKITAKP